MYDWEDAMNFAKREFENRGDYNDPQNAVDGWRGQADLASLEPHHRTDLHHGQDFFTGGGVGNVPGILMKSHGRRAARRSLASR